MILRPTLTIAMPRKDLTQSALVPLLANIDPCHRTLWDFHISEHVQWHWANFTKSLFLCSELYLAWPELGRTTSLTEFTISSTLITQNWISSSVYLVQHLTSLFKSKQSSKYPLNKGRIDIHTKNYLLTTQHHMSMSHIKNTNMKTIMARQWAISTNECSLGNVSEKSNLWCTRQWT